MNRLENLVLYNFKAFQEEISENVPSFQIGGRHMLVYGANGSGKSSVFWGLHVLMQSSVKEVQGIKKYFDPNAEESLRNIHKSATDPCYIQATFGRGDDAETVTIGYPEAVSLPDTNTPYPDPGCESTGNRFMIDSNDSSDFITHRLLIKFYNVRNSLKIDLWEVFLSDIFPYLVMDNLDVRGATLNMREVYEFLEREVNHTGKRELNPIIDGFNNKLEEVQEWVNEEATKFYNDHFSISEEKIKIQLNLTQEVRLSGRSGSYKLHPAVLTLKVFLKKGAGDFKEIKRPQSFLNEARLNAVAIAIRFAILNNRRKDGCRLLCLDDLLISLDLPNRIKVIKLILEKYTDDFQVMIFTHDKGFYNEVKRRTEALGLDFMIREFYEGAELGIPPTVIPGFGSYLARAEEAFAFHDYETAGLWLRKEAEQVLKSYLDPDQKALLGPKGWQQLTEVLNRVKSQFQEKTGKKLAKLASNKTKEKILLLKKDLSDMGLDPIETNKMRSLRSKLVDILLKAKKEEAIIPLLDGLKQITDRILNPAGHHAESPIYGPEVEEAIENVKRVRDFLGEL